MKNLIGKVVIVKANELHLPLNTASKWERRFLCQSVSPWGGSYMGAWLNDNSLDDIAEFIIEEVLE